MEATIPSLVEHPIDDLAASTHWFRLGKDSLADIIPYLSNARSSDGVWFYDFTQPNILKFLTEQRKQPGGPKSPVYDMLVAPAQGYLSVENLRASVGGRAVEVCFEQRTKEPTGLLKITQGNRHLNTHD